MSYTANYSTYANADPSVGKIPKVDREGRLYQVPSYELGPEAFEKTQTLVAGAAAPIPAAAIMGGFVQITGAAGAVAMTLPSMASTPASTDLIQLLGNFMGDLKGISNSTAGATATGPIRGIKFIISNQNNGTVTVTAPGDASITIRGSATIATTQTHECLLYAERASTGVVTYVFTKLGGV
jgi:hypothetical protein